MTDAHCHIAREGVRSLVCWPTKEARYSFAGWHPWEAAAFDGATLAALLETDPALGVGEIGLDRLKERDISPAQREAFAAQLAIAARYRRPVALHGAKCWGEVVKACEEHKGIIPAFVFHGFSRSGGLIPAIRSLNGFISVGGAVLNDHAVNYRRLVREIPDEMLLLETDATDESAPSIADIAAAVAGLRSIPLDALERLADANAARIFDLRFMICDL